VLLAQLPPGCFVLFADRDHLCPGTAPDRGQEAVDMAMPESCEGGRPALKQTQKQIELGILSQMAESSSANVTATQP